MTSWTTYSGLVAASPSPIFVQASPDNGREGAASSCSAGSDGGATPNPVLIKTGNKFNVEVDWAGDQAEMPLTITRTYNRTWTGQGVFGTNWPSAFDYKLAFYVNDSVRLGYARPVDEPSPLINGTSTSLQRIYVDRPDGSRFTFTFNVAMQRWEGDNPGSMSWLVRKGPNHWELTNEDRSIETYNDYGHVLTVKNQFGIGRSFTYLSNYRIDRVTHTSGRFLKFNWSGDARVDSIEDPAGGLYAYDYTSQGGLIKSVLTPNYNRSYHYESSNPVQMTGISVFGSRYSTYAYYADGLFKGRAKESGLAGGVQNLSFIYGTGGTVSAPTSFTEITNTQNAVTRYEFEQVNGEQRLRRVTRSGITGCADVTALTNYDGNGFIDSTVDFSGTTTDYTYNVNGQLQDMTTGINPAFPGNERLTVVEWNEAENQIKVVRTYGVTVGDPIRDVEFDYFVGSNPAVRRLKSVSLYNRSALSGVPDQLRRFAFSYSFHPSPKNKMVRTISVDGPRPGIVDTTVSTFNDFGDLVPVRDPAGNTVTYAGHNALGLPASVTDANGLVTELGYNEVGQTTLVTVKHPAGDRVTALGYEGLGAVTRVDRADGSIRLSGFDNLGLLTFT
ncbi:MAG: DUF6531 domain-containing protein [Panacagrimonas sp.]